MKRFADEENIFQPNFVLKFYDGALFECGTGITIPWLKINNSKSLCL